MQSSIVIAICACSSDKLTMVTTTETEQWVEIAGYNPDAPGIATDIVVDLDAMGQTMQGFGMCFSELSWRSHDEQTLIPLSFQLPQPQNHHSSEQQCFNDYWNMSLFDGEVSTWGWQQNSLISVDYETGSYKYNYEYYEMKHASHFINPGAVYLGTSGSHDQVLAFQNPDKSIVLLIAEKEGQAENVTITAGKKTVTVNIPANSLSTVVI